MKCQRCWYQLLCPTHLPEWSLLHLLVRNCSNPSAPSAPCDPSPLPAGRLCSLPGRLHLNKGTEQGAVWAPAESAGFYPAGLPAFYLFMLFSLFNLLDAALRTMSLFKLVLSEMRVWCDAGQIKPGQILVPELLIQFKLSDINWILAGWLGEDTLPRGWSLCNYFAKLRDNQTWIIRRRGWENITSKCGWSQGQEARSSGGCDQAACFPGFPVPMRTSLRAPSTCNLNAHVVFTFCCHYSCAHTLLIRGFLISLLSPCRVWLLSPPSPVGQHA